MTRPITLAELNRLDRRAFAERLRALFEGTTWVAEAAWPARPFRSLEELHAALCAAVEQATPEQQVALIAAHPELAGEAALRGAVGPLSAREQRQAGLTDLPESELAEFRRLNRLYRERFGFPFVICVRDYPREEILARLHARLTSDRESEVRTALREITRIWWHRLQDAVRDRATEGAPSVIAIERGGEKSDG